MPSSKEKALEVLIRRLELAVKDANEANEYGLVADIAAIAEKAWQKLQGHRSLRRKK